MYRTLNDSVAKHCVLALLGFVWCATVGSGFLGLSWHAAAPGESGFRGRRWPAESSVTFDPSRHTMLLFLHPRCPCSRASLAEFEKLLATTGKRVAAHVLVFRPGRSAEGWERTGLWDQAAAIPGVRVWSDAGGIEAERFDAVTSGLVLLFNPDGRLRFEGGITPSRGHEGDNVGKGEIVRMIEFRSNDDVSTPVFGCPLLTHSRNREKDRRP